LVICARSKTVGSPAICIPITPGYIDGLKTASELGYSDIFYGPRSLFENANDNSTIKTFRSGCFNVASLGDVEDESIGSVLRRSSIFKSEVDVLILAHHGADCATNSKGFFERVRPKVAVCSSNFANQFEHPREEVRRRLFDLKIPIYTTKTGDVIIESLNPHSSAFRVYNLISGSTQISSCKDFGAKKYSLLSANLDTIRNRYNPQPSYGARR